MKNLNDLFSNSPFAPRPQAVEEQGLRAALRAQALAGEADEWRKTRAILADYLADLGDPEEHFLRLPMLLSRAHRPYCRMWTYQLTHVRVIVAFKFLEWPSVRNDRPLGEWLPGELTLASTGAGKDDFGRQWVSMRWTGKTDRLSHPLRTIGDGSLCPGGFAGLAWLLQHCPEKASGEVAHADAD